MNIFMATSVHIPAPLLEAVDRRARALKISRNRLIVQALEREIIGGADWPAGFFERLGSGDAELSRAVQEMSIAIEAGRRSKRPIEL